MFIKTRSQHDNAPLLFQCLFLTVFGFEILRIYLSFKEIIPLAGPYSNIIGSTSVFIPPIWCFFVFRLRPPVSADVRLRIISIIPADEQSQSYFEAAFPNPDEYNGTAYIFRNGGLGRKSKFVPGLTDYLNSHPHE